MKPLRTRDDLIAFAAQHAPSKACVTAIFENRATVIGGVKSADGLPGWQVIVRSKHGREWFISIYCDEENRRYTYEYATEKAEGTSELR